MCGLLGPQYPRDLMSLMGSALYINGTFLGLFGAPGSGIAEKRQGLTQPWNWRFLVWNGIREAAIDVSGSFGDDWDPRPGSA